MLFIQVYVFHFSIHKGCRSLGGKKKCQSLGIPTDSGNLPRWKFLGLEGGHVGGGQGVCDGSNMSMCARVCVCVCVCHCKCSHFLCIHIFSEICYP